VVGTVALSTWHHNLTGHFEDLHRKRVAVGNRPVFALEHGLDPSQLAQLSSALRAHIRRLQPVNEHALAWIVYAAEVGYEYEGDEYWQTFEEQTPGWAENGSREWVRERFQAFNRQFGGARPKGPWAEHFSIICLPIRHAILPRDLQQQLARVLYESRHSFSGEVLSSPDSLGTLIASRSGDTTSRFRNLVQDRELVGHIASSLLLDDDQHGTTLLPATLARLRRDLDRERVAREWIKDARSAARDRFRLRGLATQSTRSASAARTATGGMNKGSPVGPWVPPRKPLIIERGHQRPSPPSPLDQARSDVARLRLEPRLVLRPLDMGRTTWELGLEVPDLSGLLLKFPSLHETLTNTRCKIAGAVGAPVARGQLLRGPHRVVLERWPQSDEPLLSFERSTPELRFLLRTDCLLRPGPTWLFRVASDGLAYELRGQRVRPGERYLVLTVGPHAAATEGRAVKVTCEGVRASYFELGASYASSDDAMLAALNLTTTRDVRVAPAGLAASAWDGDGRAEWIVGESPCISIRADHALEAATLVLNTDATPLELGRIAAGVPTFIALPQLPIGTYQVEVRARAQGAAEIRGTLQIQIRPGQPFDASAARGLLRPRIEPANPTFEELWSGNVSIELRGPTMYLSVAIRLLEGSGVVLHETSLHSLDLPLSADRWREHFRKRLVESAEVKSVYDRASVCEITFSAGEFGLVRLRCERESTALRWAVLREDPLLSLRLIDDTGLEAPLTAQLCPFSKPDEPRAIDAGAFSRGYVPITAPGGLYVAIKDHAATGQVRTATIVVLPHVKNLDALRLSPAISRSPRSVASASAILSNIERWGRSRVAGDMFVGASQRRVLRALSQGLCEMICGDSWMDLERGFENGSNAERDLKRAVSHEAREQGLSAALSLECEELLQVSCDQRASRFSSLLDRFLLLNSLTRERAREVEKELGWLGQLALRVASDPVNVSAWAGSSRLHGLRVLLEEPTILRAARFFVLVVSKRFQDNSLSGELFPGWSWT
jgi:hypothetical protein